MDIMSTKYGDIVKKMISKSKGSSVVTDQNVYQKGNEEILPYIDAIIEGLVLPGSQLKCAENLVALGALAQSGKTCLMLVEHYSNFDLPLLLYFLKKSGPQGAEVAKKIVAIAGFKLNEHNPLVLAFTEAYSRIVIYPSRSVEALKANGETEEVKAEVQKSIAINRAAMKSLNEAKASGEIILVFPSGTRYRPWDPSSKKGVREIDSYIKSFDYMCLVSINGNILRPNPNQDMAEDIITQDKIIIECSKPIATEEFRKNVRDVISEDDDKKQAIVDAVMAELQIMHDNNQ